MAGPAGGSRLTYGNREQVLSDQTIFQKLQDDIVGATTGYIDAAIENKKEIKKMYDKIDARVGAFTAGQSKEEFGNPSVDWGDTWRNAKTEYAELQRRIVNGDGTVEEKKRVADLDAMVDTAKGSISNIALIAEIAKEAKVNIGQMAGIDTASNNVDTLEAMEVLNGNAKGTKKLVTDLEANPPTQRWEVYNGDGKLLWSDSTANLELMIQKGGSPISVIPDETQQYENVRTNLINKETNEVDDYYYQTSGGERPKLFFRDLGNGKTEQYYKIDVDRVLAKNGTMLRANADSLSGTSVEEAIALYNNVIGPGRRDPRTDKEIPFKALPAKNPEDFVWDDATTKLFTDAYIDYGLNNFIQRERNVATFTRKALPKVSKTDKDYAQKRTIIQEDLLETAKNFDGFDQSEVGQFFGTLKAIGDDGELSENFRTNINKLGFKIEQEFRDDEENIQDVKISPQKGSKYSSITIQPGEDIRTFLRKIQESKGISERDAKDFTGYFDEEKSKQVNRKVRDRIDLGLVTDNQGNIIENPSKYNNFKD